MMKKMKMLFAAFLTSALFISLSAPCLAASDGRGAELRTTPAPSETELIRKMETMGFAQEEIDTVLQLERERIQRGDLAIGSIRPGQMEAAAFPSNPKEGDWHYETFDIHLSTINLTAAGIAGALIKGGVGAAVALVLAEAILNEITEDSGYTAIRVHMSYRYGITNDGYMGWSCGPVTWELI